jgi:hypothetical protein
MSPTYPTSPIPASFAAAGPDYLVAVYITYATLSIILTVILARTLFKNGAVFLADVFADPRMADAINRLLVVGFYLVNLGYACLLLKSDASPTAIAAIETLASKLGLLMLSLAAMHFGNLYVFHRIHARGRATAVVGSLLKSS